MLQLSQLSWGVNFSYWGRASKNHSARPWLFLLGSASRLWGTSLLPECVGAGSSPGLPQCLVTHRGLTGMGAGAGPTALAALGEPGYHAGSRALDPAGFSPLTKPEGGEGASELTAQMRHPGASNHSQRLPSCDQRKTEFPREAHRSSDSSGRKPVPSSPETLQQESKLPLEYSGDRNTTETPKAPFW